MSCPFNLTEDFCKCTNEFLGGRNRREENGFDTIKYFLYCGTKLKNFKIINEKLSCLKSLVPWGYKGLALNSKRSLLDTYHDSFTFTHTLHFDDPSKPLVFNWHFL